MRIGEYKLVNLTPHAIHLYKDGDLMLTIEKPESALRLPEEQEHLFFIGASGKQIEVKKKKFGETYQLPEPKKGVLYIVSLIVALAFPKRQDFLVTNDAVRDENGNIIGCKGFSKV